jgi:hypothetical protein
MPAAKGGVRAPVSHQATPHPTRPRQPGNYYSNKRWCCGDQHHFDLVRGRCCPLHAPAQLAAHACARAPAGPPASLFHATAACRPSPRRCRLPTPRLACPAPPSWPPANPPSNLQSVWAFEKLADMKWGVIPIQYRQVDCSKGGGRSGANGGFPGVFPPGACARAWGGGLCFPPAGVCWSSHGGAGRVSLGLVCLCRQWCPPLRASPACRTPAAPLLAERARRAPAR